MSFTFKNYTVKFADCAKSSIRGMTSDHVQLPMNHFKVCASVS